MPAEVLETVVADYYGYLESMAYAESTKRISRIVLNRFMDHYGARRAFNRITPQHIDTFMAGEAKRRTGAGLAQSHARLSAFYTWAEGTGRMKYTANPMAMRKMPRYTRPEQARIHVSKFPHMLDMAEEVSAHFRAEMAIATFSMLRIGEIKLLRMRDLDLQAGEIRADIPKTHDTDRMPISGELDTELRTWLRKYQDACGPLQSDWFLIPRVERWQTRGVSGAFVVGNQAPRCDPERPLVSQPREYRRILRAVGAPEKHPNGSVVRLGPHTLRRSGARALYDALVKQGRADALRIVQTMLHHSNMEMTQTYIGVRADRETRDTLIRGVNLFGFNQVAKIGEIGGGRNAEGEAV